MKNTYVLINPPGLGKYSKIASDDCLGLGYINASLQSEFNGYIINCVANGLTIEDLFLNSKWFRDMTESIYIGISCNFFTTIPSTVKLVKKLREIGYRGFICIGGHQAVMLRHEIISELDIDAIANGDGEITTVELMKALSGGYFDYQIQGFYYKKGHEIISTYSSAIWPELDKLPYPTRRGDEKHPLLQMNDSSQMSGVSISTSRGCPFRCVYCDISAFYHRLRRERSVENIADEMEYLYKAKRITYFSFTDDNFIGGSKHGNERAYMFVDELKKRNIPIRFNMEIRVTDATRDLLSALKSVGLYHVNMGIESGSQSMLDRWKKGIYVQDSINAIQIVEAVGLRYNINYILVDAYTTFDELLESYEFIKKTRAIEKSDEYFHIFTNELGVIHGTPIASEMKSSGLLFPKKMCRATPEEQEILDHYHPMYSYSFVDPRVDCFITNNRYWTNIVARIIENISDAEIYSRGFRRFCFRLFTLSIRAAKEKDIIFDDLSTEIESYCTFKGISF